MQVSHPLQVLDSSRLKLTFMWPFQGRQEDAEEYLGFILNGLHEEMLNLKKLLSPNNESRLWCISYKNTW